jgi:hypothetical protein
MRTLNFMTLFVVAGAAVGCGSSRPYSAPSSPGQPSGRIQSLATDVFAVDITKIKVSGQAENMDGLRTAHVLVSRRTDSRTYFVEDDRFLPDNTTDLGDAELINRSRRILDRLGIPQNEIQSAKVLTEKLQTARRDPVAGKFIRGEVTNGRRYVDMTRQVKGIPVFSSRARVGLTRGGAVGSLEAHWPVLSNETVRDAMKLQQLVQRGWKAPEQRDAVVESIEAGIIHSPALGFAMDVYPVIRVIYRAADRTIGRKPVLYLDADGRSVPIPRTFRDLKAEPASAPRARSAKP